MKQFGRIGILAALAVGLNVQVGAATWQVDTSHSTVGFSVRHLMITNVRGEFPEFSATVQWDEKDPASFSVDAVIQAASINTQNQKRDDHLRSADFFDVANHPEIRFTSRKVVRGNEGHLKVVGDLSIHGVTREVTLDVEGPTPVVKDPWGNERVGVVATAKINRTDFGLNWNQALEAGGVMVGEEVSITLDLSLVKQK